VSMDLENKNASKTPSVFTDEIRFSKKELQEIVQTAVKKAIEEEREVILQAFEDKMNDIVEQRDRLLTHELNQTLEKKRLEIAAAQEKEKKKSFFSRLFRK
ncbi:DNA-binding protein, partial [Campylobacter jejuni]